MALSCWILTDGRIGTENNARGLAEALGLTYEVFPVALRQPWRSLSPWLRIGLRWALKSPLTGPWPDILITAGRTPAVGSLYIGQQSPATVRIHITNPGVSPKLFDLVIAPVHDRLSGPNVQNSVGALHRVTAQKLEEGAAKWQSAFAHLPRPWHALLVGGNTADYTLTPQLMAGYMQKLKALGGSVLVTASRRTPPEARAEIASAADYLWDGQGDNPYFGLLALCDSLFVTADSISMLSEAASTGKPVYMLPLEGHNGKHARFHQSLLAGGYICRFDGQLSAQKPQRLEDIQQAVQRVQQLLIARGKLSR